jgi:hypothetical protein
MTSPAAVTIELQALNSSGRRRRTSVVGAVGANKQAK